MDNMRLFYRSINAESAVNHFNGFLPSVLNNKAIQLVCKLQSGDKPTNQKLVNELLAHNVLTQKEGKLYSLIPMLSSSLGESIAQEINKVFSNNNFAAEKIITKISKFAGDEWKNIGHVAMSQFVIGILWFKMWQSLADDPNYPTAVIITDLDLSKVFYPGIYPLSGNDAISFWQSPLLGHPDTIYDILHHKNVVSSLRSINEENEFLPIDNALVLLKQLNMYKNRTGGNSLPVPYVTLPAVGSDFVKGIKNELQELAQVFYNNSKQLESISKSYYQNRNQVMSEVNYHNFRQMVYLVYSHCVVEKWLNADVFPNVVAVRDRKRKQKSPTWQLVK